MTTQPQHDHHVRVWWFVFNHEYQHMLWTYIDMLKDEAHRHRLAMKDIPQPTEHEWNIAMDYIINGVITPQGNRRKP